MDEQKVAVISEEDFDQAQQTANKQGFFSRLFRRRTENNE